jgi:hypothetical protein
VGLRALSLLRAAASAAVDLRELPEAVLAATPIEDSDD